jgi:hypothetical protein
VTGPGAPGPAEIVVHAPPGPPFYEEPISVRRAREALGYLLFALFAATLIGAFLYVHSPGSWLRAKELLQIAVPAEIGLLGAVVGSTSASRRTAAEWLTFRSASLGGGPPPGLA